MLTVCIRAIRGRIPVSPPFNVVKPTCLGCRAENYFRLRVVYGRKSHFQCEGLGSLPSWGTTSLLVSEVTFDS